MRLNTASLMTSPGAPFIDLDRIDLKKYGSNPVLNRVSQEHSATLKPGFLLKTLFNLIG